MLLHFIQHVHAADYQLLAPIPQLVKSGTTGSADINTYIPALIKLVIAIAGGLAVIRIVVGGIQYMSTDAFSGKSSAKDTIQNALIGLLLAISAYTILYTVNPKLVSIDFTLQNVKVGDGIDTGLGGSSTTVSCTTANPCKTGRAVTCSSTASCSDSNIKTCTTGSPCVSGIAMCPTCVVLNDNNQNFPHLTVVQKGCSDPGPCQIDPNLSVKLTQVQSDLSHKSLPWGVTAMYPFVTSEADSCYGFPAGKCVVARIVTPGGARATAEQIATMFEALDKYEPRGVAPGIIYSYNICPQDTLNHFLTATVGNKIVQDHKDRFACSTSGASDTIIIGIGQINN